MAGSDAVRPEIVVCLGATAAHALLGPGFSVLRRHGEVVASPYCPSVLATIHPSAVLRAPDSKGRAAQEKLLVGDLKGLARLLK